MDKQKLLELIKFSNTLNVLYVEDNEEAQASTVELLRMFFQNITTAIDGQDGLDKYNSDKFDLIITDINMPIMDGLEMISHIRKDNEDIPILILTAYEESNYLLNSIQYGVDSYLLKPIQTDHLIQTLSKIIYKIRLEKENYEYKMNLQKLVEEQKQKIQDHERLIYQQSKLASMGEMIDSIAHQWKQPLNAIYMHSQNLLIEHEMLHSVNIETLEKCNENVKLQIDHLISTMDEFRNFFRPDVKLEDVLLKELLHSVEILIKNDLQSHKIKLDINCDKDMRVSIVPNEFKHILINIINNSKDAFSDDMNDRKIILSTDEDEEFNMVSIKDNAGGIPQNLMEHIFKANFTTKKEQGGTGIGLYMSKMIIEKIGGYLDVYNDSDGAVFVLKIPKNN